MADASHEGAISLGSFLDLEAVGRPAVFGGHTIDDVVEVVMQRLKGYEEDPETMQILAARKAASYVAGFFALHESGDPVHISYPEMPKEVKE